MGLIDPSLKSRNWSKPAATVADNPANPANPAKDEQNQRDASANKLLKPANPANGGRAADGPQSCDGISAKAANPANPANATQNQRDDSAKGLLKPANFSSRSFCEAIRALRADKSEHYRFSGVHHAASDRAPKKSIDHLLECLTKLGVRFSVERGRLTRWSNVSVPVDLIDEISAHEEQIAGAIGAHSICQSSEVSDGWDADNRCSCGLLATYAVYDPRQPDNERWLCEGCFDAGAPYPAAPPRRKASQRQAPITPIPVPQLQSVDRPDESKHAL